MPSSCCSPFQHTHCASGVVALARIPASINFDRNVAAAHTRSSSAIIRHQRSAHTRCPSASFQQASDSPPSCNFILQARGPTRCAFRAGLSPFAFHSLSTTSRPWPQPAGSVARRDMAASKRIGAVAVPPTHRTRVRSASMGMPPPGNFHPAAPESSMVPALVCKRRLSISLMVCDPLADMGMGRY